MEPPPYLFDGECSFLSFALFGERQKLEEILEHLKSCEDCRESLRSEFESYQKYGHDSLGTTDFPPNIATEEEFLKQWLRQRAFDEESEEFSEDMLEKVLKIDEVRCTIDRLRHRINRTVLIRSILKPGDELGSHTLTHNTNLVEGSYRKLYELMGPRAFWAWTGLNDHGEGDLEKFIENWRKVLLGEQK